MGNSSSSSSRGHHDDMVDFGYLHPQGVYTGPRDWHQAIVSQLICQRRLAPFYRPLEDYEESWDEEQILAARKELPDSEANPPDSARSVESATTNAPRSQHHKRSSTLKEPSRPEAAMYRGAVECPICFLYYPPNINHTRCCDQAICTECFVQIKRSEPTPTHLVSDPAACPYCMQEHFGVVYAPPPWRAGIGSEGTSFPWSDGKTSPHPLETTAPPTHRRRQKSFGHDSPEVVTIDQIRPDWEAKLAAVRAAVTRRANRRIIMRQVGDRLIPVGVTSGRVHAINPEDGGADGVDPAPGGSSRRSRRRQPPQGFDQLLGAMSMGGQDLEELMIMEAMRLSLLDQEERQRKEEEEKRKKGLPTTAEDQSSDAAGSTALATESTSAPSAVSTSSLAVSPSPAPGNSAHQSDSSVSTQSDRSAPNRTPSPLPAASPVAALQSMNDTSTAWRRRTSSPPPMATLSAALSASATASAFLGNPDGDAASASASASAPSPSFDARDRNQSQPGAAATSSEPMPGSATGAVQELREDVSNASTNPNRLSSASSAATHELATYDPLPSSQMPVPPSPNSAREPLLPDEAAIPKKTGASSEQPRDYFG